MLHTYFCIVVESNSKQLTKPSVSIDDDHEDDAITESSLAPILTGECLCTVFVFVCIVTKLTCMYMCPINISAYNNRHVSNFLLP